MGRESVQIDTTSNIAPELSPLSRQPLPVRFKSGARPLERKYREFLSELKGEKFLTRHVDPGNPLPPEWHLLYDYLSEEGLLDGVQLDSMYTDEVRLFMLNLYAHLEPGITDGHMPSHSGFSRGVSEDFNEAISKVFGEFLERYPLLLYKKKEFTLASLRQMKSSREKFLDPTLLASFGQTQYEALSDIQYDENSPFLWSRGHSLVSGKELYIPAQLIHWTYCHHHDGWVEPRLREPNTNGAGGHFTYEDAVLSGLYELIQRDAFFVHWFNRVSPKRIAPNTITDERLKLLVEEAERLRFEVNLLDTTTEFGIPSSVCLLYDQSGTGPRVAVGGGAGCNPADTLRRALTEACGVYHWLRQRDRVVELEEPRKPFLDRTIGQGERLLLYNNPKYTSGIDFLRTGEEISFAEYGKHSKRFASSRQELDFVVSTIATKGEGYEPVCFRATHTVLKKVGYESVRVIVPRLIPLAIHEHNIPAGAQRIREGARANNIKERSEIYTMPHPFP